MAFDGDLRRGPLLQPIGVALQGGAAVVSNVGLVEIEEDVVERLLRIQLIDRLAGEDLFLRQRTRRWRGGGRRRGRRRGWRRRRGRWRRCRWSRCCRRRI